MNFSGFVDVAIGLMLMYFVLSLICTTVNEFIATCLRWRAESLSAAITSLIDNPELRKAFYNNGLIANAKTASRGGDTPGKSSFFGTVKGFFERLSPASSKAAAPPKNNVLPATGVTNDRTVAADAGDGGGQGEADQRGQPKDPDHPSYLDGRTFAMALLQSLGKKPAVPDSTEARLTNSSAKEPMSVEGIKQIVEKLPPSSKIRDVLLASITTASADVAGLRDELGKWFDTTMDRLSGDYKRNMKRLSLIIGLLVAVVFNADSISVGKALWSDQTLRAQLVNAAQTTLQNSSAQTKCEQTDPGDATKCLLGKLKDQEQQLRPFPIGWPNKPMGSASDGWSLTWLIVLKPIGWLWTALALSLGAPFWFDLLQKFMNIRGTGPKPETTEKKANKEKAKGGAAT
jgi:hypothetical protein